MARPRWFDKSNKEGMINRDGIRGNFILRSIILYGLGVRFSGANCGVIDIYILFIVFSFEIFKKIKQETKNKTFVGINTGSLRPNLYPQHKKQAS